MGECGEMTPERIKELFNSPDAVITEEEWLQGWHWCDDFDGMLVGPRRAESEFCTCSKEIQKRMKDNS